MKGDYAGLSPKQIDHLLRGYFSWAGSAVTTATDYALRPALERGDCPAMRLKDVFLAGNFAESLPSGSSRYVSAMYEQARDVEQAYASYRDALARGDKAGAADIKASDGDKIRSQAAVGTATKLLSQLNQQAQQRWIRRRSGSGCSASSNAGMSWRAGSWVLVLLERFPGELHKGN